jgi:hypothetical protein
MTYEENDGDYRFSIVPTDPIFKKLISGDHPGEWATAEAVKLWLVENRIRYRVFIGQHKGVPYADFVFPTKDEAMQFKITWG